MKSIKMWLVVLLALGLPFQTASGNSLLVLGKHASMKRTLIVSPGSTDADSGNNLKGALASVTGTAAHPYLIKIEPGIYDLGGSILYMKPYVDIEGSGQGITIIKSRQKNNGLVWGSSNAEIRELTIINTIDGDDSGYGIRNSEASPVIRNVTVEVLGGCDIPMGIMNYQSSPMLIGVSIYVAGRGNTYGIRDLRGGTHMEDIYVEAATSGADKDVWGVYISEGGTEPTPVVLENVRAIARGGEIAYGLEFHKTFADANNVAARAEDADYNQGIHIISDPGLVSVTNSFAKAKGGFYARGIYIYNASASFSNVTATATGASVEKAGFRLTNALSPKTIRIDHCRISGSSYSIRNSGSDYTLYVGVSKLDGPVSTTGTWHCVHCYDGDNIKLTESCQ